MKLANFRVGEGPNPVVLLHGFLGSGRNLWSLARRWNELDPSLTLLLPDLTGHGKSPPFPPSGSLTTVADDVLETAQAEGLKPPYRWTGHSFGGRVALAAARAHPDAVSRIDLLDISPGPIPHEDSESGRVIQILGQMPATAADRTEMKKLLREHLSEPLTDWLLMNLEPLPGGGGVKWRIDRQALLAAHGPSLREPLWDVIEAKKVPIRCARGARSIYVPEADARRMEANGCAVTNFDSGHYVHVEALEPLAHWLKQGGQEGLPKSVSGRL